MRFPLGRTPLLFVSLCLFAASARAQSPVPLGMNLSAVTDWSSEIVFVDAFKSSRPWISQATGKAWGMGGDLAFDDKGWVKKLAPGQYAEALMFVEIDGRFPTGKYVCTYEGSGEIEFHNAGKVTGKGRNRLEVDVNPDKAFLSLRLTKTDPKNPVRNIAVRKAEHGQARFYPDFLKRYEGFKVVRFMDWLRTNDSKQEKWAERALITDSTQGANKGVCVEYCVELANTLKVDPWFCLPHLADDDYVRQFATLVKKQLKPDRKVYVEYSNETWNGQFEQARYCARKGKELKLSDNEYEGQLRYSAQRSVEIFKIFADVFGGTDRLVRVIAAHGANPWTGTTAMEWKEAYKEADAIAIAPYWGNSFGDPKTADRVSAMSVDALLDGCAKQIAENRAVNEKYVGEAKKRNLKLITYEAGQHLAGVAGSENNEKLMALFHEANRHARMKDLYLEDLKNWQEVGGELWCAFSSVGRYTKWGSWGALEHFDQDEKTAPKFQALREYLRKK